jgi:dihydrofolate reductase
LKSYWPEVAASGSGKPAENEFARALDRMPKVVFSKSLRASDWNTRVVSSDAVREVLRLKEQPGKGLLLIASPGLAASLRAADLIDEYRVLLQPVLVGNGPRLFEAAGPDLDLSLVSATPLGSGVIDLHYVRRR